MGRTRRARTKRPEREPLRWFGGRGRSTPSTLDERCKARSILAVTGKAQTTQRLLPRRSRHHPEVLTSVRSPSITGRSRCGSVVPGDLSMCCPEHVVAARRRAGACDHLAVRAGARILPPTISGPQRRRRPVPSPSLVAADVPVSSLMTKRPSRTATAIRVRRRTIKTRGTSLDREGRGRDSLRIRPDRTGCGAYSAPGISACYGRFGRRGRSEFSRGWRTTSFSVESKWIHGRSPAPTARMPRRPPM